MTPTRTESAMGVQFREVSPNRHAQHCANTRLARRGLIRGNHSMDEVVGVFVDRLIDKEARIIADRILEAQK